MTDHIKVEDSYVDAILESAAWDAARVNLAEKKDSGAKKGDEGAGKDKDDKPDFTTDARKGDKGKGEDEDDKPDFTTDARKGDKSKTKKGKKDYEDDDDDNGNGKNESVSARELAQELINSLSEDVILEFIDLLYETILNEEAETEEEEDDKEDSE